MTKIILFFMFLFYGYTGLAQTVVPVVWPFNPAASDANMIRALLETANKQQTKYEFILVNKPGAGGAVAAMSVARSTEFTILLSTSSFYIRPMLFKESHNLDDFKLVGEVCGQIPLGIFSKNYKTINAMKNTSQPVTIGVLAGSITNLITKTIEKNNSSIKFTEVFYKGTPEITTDVIGGFLEAAVDFTGPSVLNRLPNDVTVIGITGEKSVKGLVTFKSQNIKGLEHFLNSHYILVNKSTSDNVRKELNGIFNNAFINPKVKEICEEDNGILKKFSFDQVDSVYQENRKQWEKYTEGFTPE
jgi:tripartite-type tricarboxylate transporter receptor subunit TctC